MITISVREIAPIPVPVGSRLPAGIKFGRLRHDYEIYGVSRPTHNGAANHVLALPETIKAAEPASVPLTKDWQLFAVNLLSLARYGLLFSSLNLTQKDIIKRAFAGTYIGFRAFTNGKGWDDGYADYINGKNTDASPMQQETINTGGNVVELLSDILRIGGKNVYKVRTLDGTRSAPDIQQINIVKTPWLIVKATNSQRVKVLDSQGIWTGQWIEYIVEPFPQNGGYDNPAAFIGKGDYNYIASDRVELLPDNAPLPNPYRYFK